MHHQDTPPKCGMFPTVDKRHLQAGIDQERQAESKMQQIANFFDSKKQQLANFLDSIGVIFFHMAFWAMFFFSLLFFGE